MILLSPSACVVLYLLYILQRERFFNDSHTWASWFSITPHSSLFLSVVSSPTPALHTREVVRLMHYILCQRWLCKSLPFTVVLRWLSPSFISWVVGWSLSITPWLKWCQYEKQRHQGLISSKRWLFLSFDIIERLFFFADHFRDFWSPSNCNWLSLKSLCKICCCAKDIRGHHSGDRRCVYSKTKSGCSPHNKTQVKVNCTS